MRPRQPANGKSGIRIAGVQMDVELGKPVRNLARILDALRETSSNGAALTVFPECALTGYVYESAGEALEHAEPIPGRSTRAVADVCRELDAHAIFGLLERDGSRLYNACVLVGPEGVVGSYRKVHLPSLGVDKLATAGDRPFEIFEAGGVRIGMHICYDCAFPEAARVLALDGADLLVLPTNFPPGAEATAEHIINARALENHVYYAAVNRVGTERGFRFIGRSRICHPTGSTLAEAAHEREAVIYAEVDPAVARDKHLVRVPGRHEIDRFADRRPQMYARVAERGPGETNGS